MTPQPGNCSTMAGVTVKPRFAAGLSLDADDLTALMDWTERRLELSTVGHDWGVVCGLQVVFNVAGRRDDAGRECPGERPPAPPLLLTCGWGIDARQRPCIVRQEIPIRLIPSTPPGDCGCHNGHALAELDQNSGGAQADAQLEVPDSVRDLFTKEELRRVRPFDVLLEYHEVESHRRLARSIDGRRRCEPSRQRLAAVPAVVCPSCAGQAAPQETAATDPASFCKTATHAFDTGGVLRLQDWLRSQYRVVRELWSVPAIAIEKLSLETCTKVVDQFAFCLRRHHACPPAPAEPRIPLARVWAVCRNGRYEPLWIDSLPPYRRMVHGSLPFVARDWIGQSFRDAQRAAAAAGITLKQGDAAEPPDLKELQQWVEAEQKVLMQLPASGTSVSVRCRKYRKEPIVWMYASQEHPAAEEEPPKDPPVDVGQPGAPPDAPGPGDGG